MSDRLFGLSWIWIDLLMQLSAFAASDDIAIDDDDDDDDAYD